MRIKQKPGLFEGKDGTYYSAAGDTLWQIKRVEDKQIWNEKTNTLTRYAQYQVWTQAINGGVYSLANTKHFYYIGAL